MHQPTVLMRDTCCQSVQVSLLLACDKRKHINVQPEGLNCMQWAGTHKVRIWNTQVMMTSTKTSFLGLNRTTSFSSSLTLHSTSVAARTYVPKAAHPEVSSATGSAIRQALGGLWADSQGAHHAAG